MHRTLLILAALGTAGFFAHSASAQSLNYTTPYQITTLAGSTASSSGSTDSTTGTQARFNTPLGVAVDSGGNVYVADSANDTIRKITPAGAVTTFAGQAGVQGTTDSTNGTSAKFGNVYAIAIDQAGNLYVADWTPSGGTGATIRKITSSGSTSTLVPASVGLNQPYALAVDSSDNVYVADTGNSVIRKVTPGGTVSTYAGIMGQSNNVDGALGTGELGFITGLTIDSAGNLYAVDHQFDTIRKINGVGTISTLSGAVGNPGLQDGSASAGLFTHPYGIAADSSGNLYISDDTALIREISAGGTVSTLAGAASLAGQSDGIGMNAHLDNPTGVAVDSSGNLYIANAGYNNIRKGTVTATTAPAISIQPANEGTSIAPIQPGNSVMFQVTANGANLTYQWYFVTSSGATQLSDNSQVAGSKTSTLTISNVTTADQGGFYAVVSNSFGSATSNTANLTIAGGSGGSGPGGGGNPGGGGGTTGPTIRLLNLSTLAGTNTGANALAVGFSVGGTGNKSLLIRGDGPALTAYGVQNPLPDPVLNLYQGTTLVNTNTGWFTASNEVQIAAAAQQVGAFALATTSADSAMLQSLSGTGSATITGATGTAQSGNVLAEIYDADTSSTPTARLVNISSRAVVGIGQANALSAGFVLAGTGTDTVLIRGIGPALGGYGITGFLTVPTLTLLNQQTGATIATNTGWSTAANYSQIAAAFSSTGAFALTPNTADCAILIGLPAGQYTATVTGLSNATGIALVEVYEVSQSD